MVSKELFNGNDNSSATQNFYATLLHELTHWTGHKSRCDRTEKYKTKYFENFDSNEKYAFEELVAEIGACIQCCMLGITMEPTPHAIQYLKIWKDRIKAKPETIFKASALAQAGVNYIQDLQSEKLQKVS
jgi:antirestriction protein ArdC